jgi:hypothetical protein
MFAIRCIFYVYNNVSMEVCNYLDVLTIETGQVEPGATD